MPIDPIALYGACAPNVLPSVIIGLLNPAALLYRTRQPCGSHGKESFGTADFSVKESA